MNRSKKESDPLNRLESIAELQRAARISYSCNCWIAHGGAFSVVAVWVMRTNRVRVGAKVIVVDAPLPRPSATGALHVVPSIESCTS